MTPLERAARAAQGELERYSVSAEDARKAVRAVLTTIRDPSEEMRSAFGRAGQTATFMEGYRAMIDAALAEG
jgi:hypothetical protein